MHNLNLFPRMLHASNAIRIVQKQSAFGLWLDARFFHIIKWENGKTHETTDSQFCKC